MSTITTLNVTDNGATSRGVINTNFSNLNTDKAELNSPAFTGTPSLPTGTTAVTQSTGDNSTKIATTAYVDTVVGFYGCRVYQNATTAISSETALPFQVENFDTSAYHDNSTNNSRITIPAGLGGKYHIGASLNLNSDYNSQLRIRLNGTTYIARNAGDAVTNQRGCSVATIYDLVAGDYVEVTGIGGNAFATTSGDAATNFWAYKIS